MRVLLDMEDDEVAEDADDDQSDGVVAYTAPDMGGGGDLSNQSSNDS